MHSTKKGQRNFRDGLGLFWGKNRETSCPFVVKLVNARGYLKLLEYPAPLVVQCIGDSIDDAVFQKGNGSVHTASVVTGWFEQHNIQVNPIEHVWAVLKQQLHKQYPEESD